jgi:CheY-like chemotaxis protein
MTPDTSRAPLAANAPGTLGGARILAIDDSPSVIHHLRRILEGEGHVVETLGLLVELPQKLKNDPPDLIVLDLHMPALPGISFGGFIRKYQPHEIPIIIYSSRPRSELEDAAQKVQAVDFIEKGGPDLVLVGAVNRALRNAHVAGRPPAGQA